MSTGLPCIATNVGGNPDVVTHGKNGLIVKNGDENELFGAIEKIIMDKNLAESLGHQARLTAVKDFNIEDRVKLLNAHIKSLIETGQ
jgi:glycosyltransferase involved in cell wall biosynthesis